MQELEQVLTEHAARYPDMEAADYIKLVYQNEFGGGHLIADLQQAQHGILQEQEAFATASAPQGELHTEPIGNGLCRLYLDTLPQAAVPAVARLFAAAAKLVQGSEARFAQKLALLCQLAAQNRLPIDPQKLAVAVDEYRVVGCPVPSHSDAYRSAYAPHYRLLREADAAMLPAFVQAEQVAQAGGIFAIEGRCASGKSTLANAMAAVYGCPVFHLDDFFLPAELRTEQRFAQPGGNVHYERFEAEILKPFTAGHDAVFRPFDCSVFALKDPVTVKAAPFAVAEGCYSMHPALRGYYGGSVFLTHTPQRQRARILQRSGPEMLRRFEGEWIPLEERYFTGCDVPAHCGAVVDTSTLF